MSKGVLYMSSTDPYTKEEDSRFTLRIPTELLERVKREAQVNKRSTGKQIEFILEQWFSQNSSKE